MTKIKKIFYSLPLTILIVSHCTTKTKRFMNSPNNEIREQKMESEHMDDNYIMVEQLNNILKTTIDTINKPEVIDKLQNNEIVYFFGNMGAGKSTIINYMLGNQLEKYYLEQDDELVLDPDDEVLYLESSDEFSDEEKCDNKIGLLRLINEDSFGPKIQSSSKESEIKYPYPYFSQDKNVKYGYLDTPDFSDNKGDGNILSSFIGTNYIIQKNRKTESNLFSDCYRIFRNRTSTTIFK